MVNILGAINRAAQNVYGVRPAQVRSGGTAGASQRFQDTAVNQVKSDTVGAGLPSPTYSAAAAYVQDRNAPGKVTATLPAYSVRNTGGGGGSSSSRGGGGGGGGGGISAAAAAQSQMDYLVQLLAGRNWQAPQNGAALAANAALRGRINDATAQDVAASTGAYNTLDQWLGANQSNPYANVQLQHANVGPSYNQYLQTQGAAPLNTVNQNPDDSYGGFANVLALLSGNQQAGNQSRQAESQMARASSNTNINAANNAFLGQVDARDADLAVQQQAAQVTLDNERRAQLAQLAVLIGQGAKQPDLSALGLA